MKKLFSLFIAVLMVFALAFTASAEEKFEKMKDLNNYWAENDAYPDWLCGIWTETGSLDNLVVSVLDTDEGNRGKQEILGLIEDDTSVTFTYGQYSRNYLVGVKDSFTYEQFQKLGLSYTAFLDAENRIELGVLYEKRDDPDVQKSLKELKAQYGDIFKVKYVESAITNGALVLEDVPAVKYTVITEAKSSPPYLLYIAVAVSLLLSATCIFLLLKQRKALALQTAAGGTLSTTSRLSAKEVESLVRNTEVEVPEELDERIIRAIDRN